MADPGSTRLKIVVPQFELSGGFYGLRPQDCPHGKKSGRYAGQLGGTSPAMMTDDAKSALGFLAPAPYWKILRT
jgi:hypothetical protein